MYVVFLLPGYARVPVGGYAVVYDYASFMSTVPGVDVVLVHDALRLMNPAPMTLRRRLSYVRGIAAYHLGRSRIPVCKPWFNLDPSIKVLTSLRQCEKLDLRGGDVVVATAVTTAETAYHIACEHGCAGWYFLQHVEDWDFGLPYLDETLRLPLRKVAVAPWIKDHCTDIQQPCEVVPNGIDGTRFPLGSYGAERNLVTTLLNPGNPLKRTDIAVSVLNDLAGRGVKSAAFGVDERPATLDAGVTYRRRPSHPELVDLYQRSRVFFCVSETEGFGLTPAEATLAGAAVVSTNNGGVEAYARSFAVFTGEPDVDRTVSAVVTLMNDPQGARRRAMKGRQLLLGYPPEVAASRFADVILGRGENSNA